MVSVEVKIELGHRAVMKEKVSPEGFTHDWTIFVRGVEGNNIQFFVEKVVFHLHESFPKPKRVVKEPPYSVSESGYAGFIMPIDVYFRSREEPKKVTFKYDLYLRLESSPVNNIRIEKLTFNNPSDDFRNKLIRAGGIANTTGSASGGSASLSTQACIPPPHHIEDHPPVVAPAPIPKHVVVEKKPRPHVPSKEIKPPQPPPPKPSQPFTDIFGAPIRTKKSPSETITTVKSKDSGHSSQVKSKSSLNSSSNSSSKESKSSSKESHKSKDNHHSSKESRHTSRENHHSSKESHLAKEIYHSSKEVFQEKSILHQSKDSIPPKESHHSVKEAHHKPKEHHLKDGHKKDSHHSSKEAKPIKDNRSSDSKEPKPPKLIKPDKESNKSVIKRVAPTDSHDSHGNPEKKKKPSPVPSESSDKSSCHSKHKIKESKDKTVKQKIKLHSNSIKKEEEKSKHKNSPAPHMEIIEPKEMPKPPKPFSPKPPSTPPLPPPPPPPVVRQPPPKSPSPSPSVSSFSSSLDSDDESQKSSYNKAHYSSPASSISESSLHSNIHGLSDHSIISPLSDDDDDDDAFSPPPPKRKVSSDYELDDDRSQEPKPFEFRVSQKLSKKSHHRSSKHKSEIFHQGNGSFHSDVSMQSSPSPEGQSNSISNSTYITSSYVDELMEIQRKIMATDDRKLLQNIVDVIETTGKYEITNTTFDFDLCSLDRGVIHKIKLCLTNCDKC